jgi:chromosome segregation ATPase
MKKIFIIAAGILMMSACGNQNQNESDMRLQQQVDSLQTIVDNKDSELNDIIVTMTEVQNGIRRIAEAEGRVTVADGNQENVSSRAIIRDNMEYICEAMQQNRELVAQLREKLNASRFKADKLKNLVDGLQSQVESQNQRIQELQASLVEKDSTILAQTMRIDSLSQNVASLTESAKENDGTMVRQEKQINNAWFVFGTKAELKEQGILKGGEVLKDAGFNKDYFTEIDIRQVKNIKTYSKSARLLTTHPDGSYMLAKDAKGYYELHISNPSRFWSVSRYLVMQVK